MGYVVGLDEIGRAQADEVGGKAANLGELSRIDGVRVPGGFCVTAAAFRDALAGSPRAPAVLARLAGLAPTDREAIGAVSAEVRRLVEEAPLPDGLVAEVGAALARLGERGAYAVRSSATAEDLPTASAAGQQDSYLNVAGPAVLEHVRRCWASLFTERAVTYRLRGGHDHLEVRMAVIVQAMVFPEAAGVLFTADPVTSDRRVVTVEAVRGLGEALVSGRVDGDVHTVRDDEVVGRTVGRQLLAVHALPGGGTEERPVEPGWRARPVLTDAQVLRLARTGRRIEAHYGHPQDVEWCLVDDEVHVVQSRPITTLFPVPATDDGAPHLYVSVGHQQMMTDAMKPLGLSFWQLTTPRPMAEAGGRLFVDIAPALASPAGRAALLEGLGRHDPLIGDAVRTVLDRGDLVRPLPDGGPADVPAGGGPAPIETDPAVVTELVERSRASLAALRRDIEAVSGPALFAFIAADLGELRRILFDPRSLQVITAGMEAAEWLDRHLGEWLGERDATAALTQSVPHNVTSEMGLALLDVADAVRPHPEVVAFLRRVDREGCDDGTFLDELARVPGGPAARGALRAFLDTYGARCPGEIDITRPRWSEHPTALVRTILGHVENHEPGAAARRFERGRQRAREVEQELLRELRTRPDGHRRAEETERMIRRVRAFTGYREYPKYGMVGRYHLYRRALVREAEGLVRAGVVGEVDDVFFLRFEEFHEAVRTHRVDEELVRRRKEEFRTFQGLTPPRVMTSDGEVVTGSYRRDHLPPGALPGLAVSAGAVEGRARVVLDMARADLGAGDILVTTSTDPGWTPLFVGIEALVTEVGGLMTHGAVIAREYGLPAVVGVVDATRRIRDGQRIRVHGTEGYVEILS